MASQLLTAITSACTPRPRSFVQTPGSISLSPSVVLGRGYQPGNGHGSRHHHM